MRRIVTSQSFSVALYDWTRRKHVFVTSDWAPPGKWMIICDVDSGPGMRFYRDTEGEALAFAARWITCKHDRTPQPVYNAWGAQCGWRQG